MKETTQCMTLGAWPLPLSMMFLRRLHVVARTRASFLPTVNTRLCEYAAVACPFTCWWIFGLFLPFGNCKQCGYKPVFKVLRGHLFHLHTPRSRIAASHGTLMFIFLRSCRSLFCITGAPFYIPTNNAWAFLKVISERMTWYLIVALICISEMTNSDIATVVLTGQASGPLYIIKND